MVRCRGLCAETQFVRAKVSVWETQDALCPAPRPRWRPEPLYALVICCPGRGRHYTEPPLTGTEAGRSHLPADGVSSGVTCGGCSQSRAPGLLGGGPLLSLRSRTSVSISKAETLPLKGRVARNLVTQVLSAHPTGED